MTCLVVPGREVFLSFAFWAAGLLSSFAINTVLGGGQLSLLKVSAWVLS